MKRFGFVLGWQYWPGAKKPRISCAEYRPLHAGLWAGLLVVILVLVVGGCSKKESEGGSGSSAGAASDPAVISGKGDAEAVKALGDELAKRWLRTADGWISEYPAQTYLATGKRAGPDSFYREIKELKFVLEASGISESDKLNGVQFRGSATFTQAPTRVYGDPNAFGPKKWSEWKGSFETVNVQKVNGRWSFGSNLGYIVEGEKPAAATVAGLK